MENHCNCTKCGALVSEEEIFTRANSSLLDQFQEYCTPCFMGLMVPMVKRINYSKDRIKPLPHQGLKPNQTFLFPMGELIEKVNKKKHDPLLMWFRIIKQGKHEK